MKKTEFIDGFADLHDDEEILRIDGFDEACIGWTDTWSGNNRPIRLVYDAVKIIQILMQQGMDEIIQHQTSRSKSYFSQIP